MAAVSKRKPSFAKLAISATEKLTTRRMTLTARNLQLPGDTSETKQEEKPKIKMENTFKMIPDEDKRFSTAKAKKEIHNIFQNYLGDMAYDSARCSDLCLDLSVLVKNKMKELAFPRYKFICNVIMGQCNEQGLETASRSIWDPKTDNFTYYVYNNSSLYAIGIVHAVYFE
ncbi:Hypothetical predicted protein [Mytilus galloprovincialis]|uniref:Uncharacterized protein n=1 Tax=Mytilus galloprovincialis TaxID=29158 RepID=A0A8B6C0H9_MYTGA|nr:Hypothetical predicted protein [Mytilus galloprovincialis]